MLIGIVMYYYYYIVSNTELKLSTLDGLGGCKDGGIQWPDKVKGEVTIKNYKTANIYNPFNTIPFIWIALCTCSLLVCSYTYLVHANGEVQAGGSSNIKTATNLLNNGNNVGPGNNSGSSNAGDELYTIQSNDRILFCSITSVLYIFLISTNLFICICFPQIYIILLVAQRLLITNIGYITADEDDWSKNWNFIMMPLLYSAVFKYFKINKQLDYSGIENKILFSKTRLGSSGTGTGTGTGVVNGNGNGNGNGIGVVNGNANVSGDLNNLLIRSGSNAPTYLQSDKLRGALEAATSYMGNKTRSGQLGKSEKKKWNTVISIIASVKAATTSPNSSFKKTDFKEFKTELDNIKKKENGGILPDKFDRYITELHRKLKDSYPDIIKTVLGDRTV
jgi:hypothetical protein